MKEKMLELADTLIEIELAQRDVRHGKILTEARFKKERLGIADELWDEVRPSLYDSIYAELKPHIEASLIREIAYNLIHEIAGVKTNQPMKKDDFIKLLRMLLDAIQERQKQFSDRQILEIKEKRGDMGKYASEILSVFGDVARAIYILIDILDMVGDTTVGCELTSVVREGTQTKGFFISCWYEADRYEQELKKMGLK